MIKFRPAELSLFLISIFYAWYVLPMTGALFAGARFNVLFFACYVLGILGLLFAKKGKLKLNRIVCIVAVYCLAIIVMTILGIGDAGRHVRVGLVFFSTILLYFLVLNTDQRVKLGKYLLALFLITCVTSSIGVVTNNSAARTISHAAADDDLQRSLSLLNIAGIYLFQCMVMLIPALYGALQKRKVFRIVLIMGIGAVLLNASFSIALVMYALAIVLVYYNTHSASSASKALIILLLFGAIGVFYAVGYDLLTYISEILPNDYISERILNIRNFMYGMKLTGGTLAIRLKQYMISWDTFLKNPLGVGPYYAYKGTAEGIGYHSQILDDLARYGVFAFVMYIGFFVEYNRWLRREWGKIGAGWVASATTTLYILFLILNLGMRSGIESVVMTFIIPTIPEIILSNKNKGRLTVR